MKKAKKLLSGFIIIFLVVLIALNTLINIMVIDRIKDINYHMKKINEKISIIETSDIREQTLSEEKIVELYKELSDKTDEAINRILTLVGIVAGIVTFFSLLLAYKAPHDIDKRIDDLNTMIGETKIATEEAKYQAMISSAMAKTTRYESIKKLSEIIHKYPEKPDAYVIRGFMYDDIRRYDIAITDYETAKKFGCDLNTYYNSMGIAYSNKGNNKKAIVYYSKAIKIDINNASYYCNRACSYDELEELEKALKDYDKAIELDPDFYEAYFNRNFTYDKLWRQETDIKQRNEYIQNRKDDLEKSIELNPEDDKAAKMLKKFIGELMEKGIIANPLDRIAEMDEKIADVNKDAGNMEEAYRHYNSALDYYAKQVYVNKKEHHNDDVDRIINKIIEIILNKNESANIIIDDKTNPLLTTQIASMGYKCYIDGDKVNAEILFSSILPLNGSALNLAFMKRRNETVSTQESVMKLLDMAEDKDSAIWCINSALCYIDSIEVDANWGTAINIVKNASSDIENAIEWWSNQDLVGKKESNVVFLLLIYSGLYSESDESINNRIRSAEQDGYIIPEEYK